MTSTVYKTVSSQSLPAIPCENDGMLMRESDTYEVLRKKKLALEEKYKLKVQQLRSICLKEADIIGQLPPETPLDPGEPVPQIRKRVGAEFYLNSNLLSKARCWEEENLAKLELELELQRKIVKANLKLTNEVNLKRNVKKKRLQNYQDAVLRLKELEKKFFELKKKVEDGDQFGDHKARSEINYSGSNRSSYDVRPKSSLALVSNSVHDNGDDDDEDIKSGEAKESYLSSTSVPGTPVKLRESERHIRPISPPTTITSSIVPNRYELRPSSVHFPFEKGGCDLDNHQPERCKTTEHFFHDYDSCSIGSASSCESSIFNRINNDTKRRNILSLLQTHNSNESLDTVTSHLYSLPKRNPISESIGSSSKLNDISESKFNNNQPGSSELKDVNLLNRQDSIENARRKSYVSAIGTHHPTGNSLRFNHKSQPSSQYHYYCLDDGSVLDCDEFTRPEVTSKTHRSSQQLCLPPTSVNMASRPLPPPPSSSCSSSSSRASPLMHHHFDNSSFNLKLDESKLYQNIYELDRGGSVSDHDHLDISLKAVRSSIIRTPIAITISSSSNDPTQPPTNHRLPSSPTPSIPPRTPSSVPSSAATLQNDGNIFFATKATTYNPDKCEASHSFMSPPKIWSETDLDSYPSKVDRKIDSKYDSSYNIYYNEPFNIDTTLTSSHDYENIEPIADTSDPRSRSTVASSKSSCSTSSSSKVSPRPPSIPLSPTISPAANGVEVNVVSVGHFQPYWEETKPYELSDFFKYSAKHRKKTLNETQSNRSSLISASSSSLSLNQPQSIQQHPPSKCSASSVKANLNKLTNSNMQSKRVVGSSHHHRDIHSSTRSNEPISTIQPSNANHKDGSANKDLYKDDANWYENDIIENPSIV